MSENIQAIELFKTEVDDFRVEYDFVRTESENAEGINEIDNFIESISQKVSDLDREIDKLTSTADAFDYSVAVASGILTGLIDSFYVGEINWNQAKADSHKFFNDAIMRKAKGIGYEGDRLDGAIKRLEDAYKIPSDNLWPGVSSTRYHHLEDLAHHPTLLGLLANIVTTLFRTGVFGTYQSGGNVEKLEWKFPLATTNFKEMAKIWGPILLTAVLHWLVSVAEKKYTEEQQKELPVPVRRLLRLVASAPDIIEFVRIVDNWVGHLMSDMCGSKQSADGGMGIPGVFLSLLSEIAFVCQITPLARLTHNWYKSGFDMRIEGAVLRVAGKQAVPVLLNELFVRSFYFIRRLIPEIRQHGTNWGEYDWEKTVPFSNRTIVRMLTVSNGTFVALDLADASIRTAISGQYIDVSTFLAKMALRVNFVGIGRFSIALFSDAKMGIQRYAKVSQRIDQNSKMLNFYNAKIYYKQADMWVAAEESEVATQDLYQVAQQVNSFFSSAYTEMKNEISQIGSYVPGIDKHNPGLRNDILSILED